MMIDSALRRTVACRALIAATAVGAGVLAGCEEAEEIFNPEGEPFETYSFKYALAEPSDEGTYTVTDPDGNACPVFRTTSR